MTRKRMFLRFADFQAGDIVIIGRAKYLILERQTDPIRYVMEHTNKPGSMYMFQPYHGVRAIETAGRWGQTENQT